jgi:hypothetical protein
LYSSKNASTSFHAFSTIKFLQKTIRFKLLQKTI